VPSSLQHLVIEFPVEAVFNGCEHMDRTMKAKTRHRKSYKWRKRADSSPVAKGRRPKLRGTRNPRKHKHVGGKGL